MVQVETSQLTGECSTWRETLRKYRDEFTQDKQKLQLAASHPLTKDQLQDVEHLHNQFHIQLINIHDLKQAVKAHERRINFELSSQEGNLSESIYTDHESLYGEFQGLDNTLSELRREFDTFLLRTQ